MNSLATLATTALLGTERRPPEWPAHDGALGALLGRMPRESAEKALLQTAGVLGVCHLAGWKPPAVETATAPAPLDDADRAEARPAIVQTLGSLIADGPERLQGEAFRMLARAGKLLPHRLLPKALDAARRSLALRPALLGVLGQRGAWLAAQNETWAFACGGGGSSDQLDDDVWQHGSLDQRKLYLTALHAQNAARARELIAAAFTTEGARERTAFVECLAASLSLADQDLLEATLTDKGKEARQAAASLLSALPESRYVQRMAARLQPCLTMEKKFLRGTVITLEPPTAFVAEWKAELLEEARPKNVTMGERAWWLLQMVRAVPLAWWEQQTGLKPAELIEWGQKSDWKDALLQGWAAAQTAQKRVEWAEAFLSVEIRAGVALDPLDLLATLPQVSREKHFIHLLTSASSKWQGSAGYILLQRFMASLPLDAPPLAEATARRLMQVLKQRINSGEARYDWQLRPLLPEVACLIPPSLFGEFATGWDITKEEVQPFAEAIARVSTVLDQRQQLQSLT